MTLTTAYSQDQYIAPEKVNILQAINEIYNKKHQREKIENQFKEFESKSKIQDTVRIIKAQGTCLRLMATKRLFITMQTYISPLDTVIKIITNVKTFCDSSSFSMPVVEFGKDIMVIETVDNEIITLYSTSAKNNIEIRPYGTTYRRFHYTYRHLHYWNISVENINKLKSGVKKIKIKSKWGEGLYEKEFEKDKIGTILYDGYLSELKQMAKDKNQDFKDNF